MLVRIVAPHFVAGLVIEAGVVIRAAPIIGYMVGWQDDRARAYVRRKDWRASIIPAIPRETADQ